MEKIYAKVHSLGQILRRDLSSWKTFLLTFVVFAIHLLTSKYSKLYYDADGYWYLATLFHKNTFSLYSFDSALRGYLFPLLNYPLVWLCESYLPDYKMEIIKISGAIWAASLFGVVLPKLWVLATAQRVGAGRKMMFVALCFFFWRDYFNFTLTDFPAFTVLAIAVLLVFYLENIFAAVGLGVLSAAAIYFRPVYLLSIPFLLLLVGWRHYKSKEIATLEFGGRVVVILLSFAFVSLPQYMINKHNFNSNSFLVLGEGSKENSSYKVGKNSDLYLWQLNQGIVIQRYETNIGEDYPIAQANFADAAGKKMMADNFSPDLISYSEYFAFAFSHPVDMLTLYCRHLFNGMDLLFSSPYVLHLLNSSVFFSLIMYTVLFISGLVVYKSINTLKIWQWLVVAVLLAPCAASVPIVVETRFFIPLHLLLYAVICFGWKPGWQFGMMSQHRRVKYSLCYAIFLLACFTLSGTVQAALELSPKLWQNG